MSGYRRTISFLKRNGIRNTCIAAAERLCLFGADPEQKKANAYVGDGKIGTYGSTGTYGSAATRRSTGTCESTGVYESTGTCADDLSGAANDETSRSILYSILVPAYETNEAYLVQLMDSVKGQTYQNWELIVADASETDIVCKTVKAYAKEETRIRYIRLAENKGISENTNEALVCAKGDYIGLLDHDDVLCADALFEINRMLSQENYDIVYTDEDKMSGDCSRFFEPNFKLDFNLDYLLSNNYFCHFTVMRASLMKKLKFRSAYDGAQDYDLFLRAVYEIEQQRRQTAAGTTAGETHADRQTAAGTTAGETHADRQTAAGTTAGEAHADRQTAAGTTAGETHADRQTAGAQTPEEGTAGIPYPEDYMQAKIGHVAKVLYHWRAHVSSTADNPESKRYAYEAGKRALEDFLAKNGWKAQVAHMKHLGFYQVNYQPDLFSVRPDVYGVCGKTVHAGRISVGPVVDGRERFNGMNDRYSGYLHRAVLMLSVSCAENGVPVRYRDGAAPDEERKKKGRLVYLPDFVVRK